MTNPDAPAGGDGRPAHAETPAAAPLDFIRDIIDSDLRSGKHTTVATRFPPEPNGYLHIGHAKSICLNFGVANEFGGTCNLRFDDTNPAKEDVEYVDSIIDTVRWLGFDWADRLYYASDYFEEIYKYTLGLIRDGKAYVDELTAEEIRDHRGTLTEPGRESPWRDRPVEESLDLFARMRKRVRGRRQGAAREDRHGVAEHQSARPGPLPHPARHPPPHRRRVVHLPDV
jgi:glutaminyl-tRNA synthetase